MTDIFNMRAAIAKLKPDHLVAYLLAQDWESSQTPLADRILFLGANHGDGRYELILPANPSVRNSRVLLQRAIYKLCGIEDRDPHEVLADVFAEFERSGRSRTASQGKLIRFRNRGLAPLKVRITSRSGEYNLLPDESIEVALQVSADTVPEFECSGNSIVIHDR